MAAHAGGHHGRGLHAPTQEVGMKTSSTHDNTRKDRRSFLKKAGTAAAAVPAAAVLLSLADKSALAQTQSGGVTAPTSE
jgi:hypothetical protein